MSADAIRDKWDRIYASSTEDEPEAAEVLSNNAHLLPPSGDALDLACGLGGNALFLARRGFRVSAWDISPLAVARIASLAGRSGLKVEAQTRDVEAEPIPLAAFDVVVVSRFLARALAGPIGVSLRPGGLLFYQTFVRGKLHPAGPSNPDYLLAENELLELFASLHVVFYREDGRVGDLSFGNRNEAYFVGQKQ